MLLFIKLFVCTVCLFESYDIELKKYCTHIVVLVVGVERAVGAERGEGFDGQRLVGDDVSL